MKIIILISLLLISQSVNANKMLDKDYLASKLSKIIETENLTLSKINDTLFYGQNYPEERFPIYIINGKISIPIFHPDTCTIKKLEKYLYKFNSKKMYVLQGTNYLLPLNLINNYLEDINIDKSNLKIKDVYDCGLENFNGYEGKIRFNNLTNEIIISCYTKQEFSNCNNFITGEIVIDSSKNLVSIRPKVNTPNMLLDAFGRAGGEIRFRPPSDRFQMFFGKDLFNVILSDNKVFIKTDSLITNIIKVE